nr:reverse transcriptase domain-containing protein [Tanacetum cinerariifolium]
MLAILKVVIGGKDMLGKLLKKFDETFSEAWDHFKDLLRKCPHHGFSELHQIDTFYNSLTQSDQDLLNAAVSGNLLSRMPRDALAIIENNSKVRTSRNKLVESKVNNTASSSPSPDITALTDIVKELVLIDKANQQASVKFIEETCVTCGGPHPYYECLATDSNTFNASAATRTNNQRGDVKAITTRSGIAYDGPIIPPTPSPLLKEVEREIEATKDMVQATSLESTEHVQTLVVQVPTLDPVNLSLPDLTPTRMTLELPTRSLAYPAGIAEDVFVQVGKSTFPADFVVVDYDVDSRVPLILGRPFLRMARALVDVYGKELILRDGDEKLIFHADSTPKHPHKHGNELINMINFIDITCEDCFLEILKFKKLNHPSSGSTTPLSDFSPSLTPFKTSDSLLEEDEFLVNQDPSSESNIETIDPILEKFIDEPALDYLPPSGDDDDDLFNLKSDNDEWKKLLYGDCYKDTDFKKDKNKDSKMKSLVVEAHIVKSNNLLL